MTIEKQQEWERRIEEAVLNELDFSEEIEDEVVYRFIDNAIARCSKEQYLSLEEKLVIRTGVFQSMRQYDVLTPLLQQEDITEIMVNGYNRIYAEQNGVISRLPLSFRSEEKYLSMIQQIVAGTNRVVNESSPIVDARLKDGSRVNVVLSPISLDGAAMTIRKFPKEPLDMQCLIDRQSLGEEHARLLKYLVRSGYNIIISGGTGSGKTTFLNALSDFIPKEERIITIEDAAELQLKGIDNLVRMEVRNANVEGRLAVPMKQLIKASLRMRPDRIIVGEVRGEEALDMLQALNTGHDGSISTGHANSARDMLTRLETMVLMGIDMPMTALRGQLASAIEIIVHLGRLRDYSRRVLEIVEVLDMENGEIKCQSLFQFVEKEEASLEVREETEYMHLPVQGQLYPKNTLMQSKKLKEAGYYERFVALMEELEKQT